MEASNAPESIEQSLRKEVEQRDQLLSTLKARTKAFVDSLRAEKAAVDTQLQLQIEAKDALNGELVGLKKQMALYREKYGGTPDPQAAGNGVSNEEIINQWKKEVEDLKSQHLGTQEELTKNQATSRRLMEEMAMHKQQNATLMQELAVVGKREKEAATQLETAKRRSSNLTEEMTMLKQQQTKMFKELQSKMDAESKARKKELQEAKQKVKEAEEVKKRLTSLQAELQGRQQREGELEKQLEGLKGDLSEDEAKRESLIGTIEELRAAVAAAEKASSSTGSTSAAPSTAVIPDLMCMSPPPLMTTPAPSTSADAVVPEGQPSQQQQKPPIQDSNNTMDFLSFTPSSSPAPPLPSPSSLAHSLALSPQPQSTSTSSATSAPPQPVAMPTPTSSTAKIDEEVASLRQQLQKAEAKLSSSRQRIASLTERLDAAEKEAAAKLQAAEQGAQEALSKAETRAKSQASDLEAASEKMAKLIQEQEGLKAELTKVQGELLSSSTMKTGSTVGGDGASLEGLSGEMQHMKTIMLEREATIKERDAQLERVKSELASVSEEAEATSRELASLVEEKSSVAKAIEIVNADKSELIEEKEVLRHDRDRLQELLDTKSTALTSLEEAYEKQKKIVAEAEKVAKDYQRSHQDQLASQKREAEETIRRIKSDAETELSGARFQLNEAIQAKIIMEKQVAAMNAQVEALKRSIQQLSEESEATVTDLEASNAQLSAELTSERENGQERRRQMKLYLETLTREKAELEGEVNEAKSALAEGRKSEVQLRQSVQDLEGRLAAQVAANETKVKGLEDRIKEKTEAMRQAISERDVELAKLRAEQALRMDNTTKRSEEMQHNLQAAEAETAAHKAKRLAAKTEMIQMAQALEEMTSATRVLDENLSTNLVPRALEQIAVLEHAIVQVDEAVRLLTNNRRNRGTGGGSVELRSMSLGFRSRTGRLVNLGRRSSSSYPKDGDGQGRDVRSPSAEMLMSSNSPHSLDGSSSEYMGEAKMEGRVEPGEPPLGGTPRMRTNSRTQASIEKLDRLDVEMDRVSAGVNLLQQSVQKLQDAVIVLKEGPTFLKLLRECFSLLRQRSSSQSYTRVMLDDHPVSPERITRRGSRGRSSGGAGGGGGTGTVDLV